MFKGWGGYKNPKGGATAAATPPSSQTAGVQTGETPRGLEMDQRRVGEELGLGVLGPRSRDWRQCVGMVEEG